MNDVKSSEKLAQGALSAELPKVALTQGAQTQGALAQGALAQGATATAERTAVGAMEAGGDTALNGWLEALQTAAASAVIRASGLPAAVQDRLEGARYETAEQVYDAVNRARAELAALAEAGVVQLGGGRAGRGGRRRGWATRWMRRAGWWPSSSARPTPPRRRPICAPSPTSTWR